MDPSEYAWEHDENTNTIVAMTTMVVRTYIHLGRIHEEAEPVVPPIVSPAPDNFLGALLRQPLGPWDFPLKPLPDFEMEPMSIGLPSAGPQPDISVIELSSMATPRATTVSLPYPEYHMGAAL